MKMTGLEVALAKQQVLACFTSFFNATEWNMSAGGGRNLRAMARYM
jgi:hypothetical protein